MGHTIQARNWWIDEPLVMGSSNPTDQDLGQLRAEGFSVVFSFLDEKEQPPNYDKQRAIASGWKTCSCPVEEAGVASLDQLSEFIASVKALPRGTKVLMHCESGLGRTAFMAAAYWIANGLTATEAIDRVKQAASDDGWNTPQRESILQKYDQKTNAESDDKVLSQEANALQSTQKSTVRNKLWLWGHVAGAHNDGWGLPGRSRMPPTEAAIYLGIPNLIMVRYLGQPALPFDQYALRFRALNQVVWSVVGARGQTSEEEQAHVLDLAGRHPNLTGLMLDDFFGSEQPAQGNDEAALPADKLRELRSHLTVVGRRLRLWAVLYDHQLERPLAPYLEFLDLVSLWTWDSDKLKRLEANLERLEKVAPGCGRVLGCYMWDYGRKRPMPLDLMRHQCELGLDWLRQGRIEGLIFLASCVCDLELEAVEWTRSWIAQVGDRQL
jgi:hypothetical protein